MGTMTIFVPPPPLLNLLFQGGGKLDVRGIRSRSNNDVMLGGYG